MKRRDVLKLMGVGCIGCCCQPLEAFAAMGQVKTYSTAELLEEYDQGRAGRKKLYLPWYTEGTIDSVLDDMRDSYETIIPDIPYIGKRNFHLQWLIPNSQKLADYLVAKEGGVSIKDFSQTHLDSALASLMEMPEDQRRMIGSMQFGLLSNLMMRFVAWRSQLRLFPENYILKFVRGNGEDFDWGCDYYQCPNVTLYSRHGAADLVHPLVCTMDYVAGKALFVGYHRTMDLATGGTMCDLRWKEGVESEIPEI